MEELEFIDLETSIGIWVSSNANSNKTSHEHDRCGDTDPHENGRDYDSRVADHEIGPVTEPVVVLGGFSAVARGDGHSSRVVGDRHVSSDCGIISAKNQREGASEDEEGKQKLHDTGAEWSQSECSRDDARRQ